MRAMQAQIQRMCERCRMETAHSVASGEPHCDRCAYIDVEAAKIVQAEQLQREIQERAAVAMGTQRVAVRDQEAQAAAAVLAARKAKIKARDAKFLLVLVAGVVVLGVASVAVPRQRSSPATEAELWPAKPAHSQDPTSGQGTLIPRSRVGDKGQYYLLEQSRSGDVVTALHKRVGVETVDFSLTETNCSAMLMRELGVSSTSPQDIRVDPTKWFDLEPGSSKSDLAKFVCGR